jgi:patatin-related protein
VSTAEQIEASSIATEETSANVAMDVEREIRFAVVMYGGVSLAIYINGVAQELLNMVRATAPEKPGEGSLTLLRAREPDLPGAIPVYRKLGQYLAVRDRSRRDEKLMQTGPTTDLIRIRFVVDIISGTSAGGINGVFLAKALARNQQMDGLKKLWLSEGDLAKLLNDKWSIKDLRGFKVQKPQQSLLNSQRMYRKLLETAANNAHSLYEKLKAQGFTVFPDKEEYARGDNRTCSVEGL